MTEIAAQTGMSIQTVRRRLRLRSLASAPRAAFDEGKLTVRSPKRPLGLAGAHQKALERHLAAAGRLSLADVRDVGRGRTAAASGEVPGGLCEEHEVAWEVTVRDHLTAALRDIPLGEGYDALRRVNRRGSGGA